MSVVLMLADFFGEEYDSFCSISIAGIVIYFLNPLCVFDISFLMSFGCVAGIAVLYKPEDNFLEVLKLVEEINQKANASAIPQAKNVGFQLQTLKENGYTGFVIFGNPQIKEI